MPASTPDDLGPTLVRFLRTQGCMRTWSSREIGEAFGVTGAYIRNIARGQVIRAERARQYLRIAMVEYDYPRVVIVVDPESDSTWISMVDGDTGPGDVAPDGGAS
ncbi:MAG TPA: hypothetical protein VI911_04280 [Patescibacteria group bacterium]|nr:hypothetical protein [Patescibacteria group bacterium]